MKEPMKILTTFFVVSIALNGRKLGRLQKVTTYRMLAKGFQKVDGSEPEPFM